MSAANSLRERARASLLAAFIGDAIAMPVHWYYNVADIYHDFGVIQGYEAPKKRHPTSGMPAKDVIGKIILKGREQFWGTTNVHYHQGMHAGECTLNSQIARVVLRSVVSHGGYDTDSFLSDYAAFMTTPGTHNDTYAEAYHCTFFANFARGSPLRECAAPEGPGSVDIGGLTTIAPVVVAFMAQGDEAAVKASVSHLALTHISASLTRAAEAYSQLLLDLIHGEPLREACLVAAEASGTIEPKRLEQLWNSAPAPAAGAERGRHYDESIVAQLGLPCPITKSFPVVLFLAGRHSNNIELALCTNAQCGGDSVHRGTVLGALLGAAAGTVERLPKHLVDELAESSTLKKEIDEFLNVVLR